MPIFLVLQHIYQTKNNYPETVTSIDETPINDQPPGKNSGDEGEENVAVVKIVEFLSFPICMISF